MKKILLLFALLLLPGCIWPWGGSKDELELVPKSANSVIILRPSAIFNDSDISSFYSQANITDEVGRVEATTGIDETKINRMVLFMKFESTKPSRSSYGGFIVRGAIDKNKILESMKLNNIIANMSYGNQPVYEVSAKQAPQNKSYFYFFDSNTLVGGTREAVQDSIDASSGKTESVKSRQKLSQTYDALDKNSLLIFLLDIPPQLKSDISQSAGNLSNSKAFSRVDCVGLSLAKEGRNININLQAAAEDAPSANDASNAIGDGLSTLKGLAPSGSVFETIINKMNVGAKGDKVTASLTITFDELKSLRDELYPPPPTQSSTDYHLIQQAQTASYKLANYADIVGAQGYPKKITVQLSIPEGTGNITVGTPHGGIGKYIVLSVNTSSGVKELFATTTANVAGDLSNISKPGTYTIMISAEDSCTQVDPLQQCVYIETANESNSTRTEMPAD